MPFNAVVALTSVFIAVGWSLEYVAALETDQGLPISLRDCLEKTDSWVLWPGTEEYDLRSKPQNANYHPHPEVIVIPSSSDAVAAIMRCITAEKGSVKLSPRGGGHSYAAYSFAGQVVIDSSNMTAITFNDQCGEVTAQFGQTLGPLATAMGQKGYALPHGTCPGVGISGHGLGGGWGYTSRKWGWLVDHITSVEFVDVDGNIKLLNKCSTGYDAELWWALRGAGAANFGIVTSFTYAMEAAPTAVVNYDIPFASKSDCARLLLAVQEMGMLSADDMGGLPLEFGGQVTVTGGHDGGSTCTLRGQYLGKKSDFMGIVLRLFGSLAILGVRPMESKAKIREFGDWIDCLTDLMGDLDLPSLRPYYYAQSLVDDGLPIYTLADVERIIDAIRAANSNMGLNTYASFDLNGWGSTTNQFPATGDMAFIHRNSLFVTQIYSSNFPGFNDTGSRVEALKLINDIRDSIKNASPNGEWHAYQNYIDPYLENFGKAYYGSNLGRLKALKLTADPHRIFDFAQGLSYA